MSAPKKVVVLLSGGLDSSLALAELLAKPLEEVERVLALIMSYGQSSAEEVACAVKLCTQWKVPYHLHSMQLLTDSDVHQEIPGRNLVFVALAASLAIKMRYNAVAVGSEPDDVFTDSSKLFLGRAKSVLELFDLDLLAPVKNYTSKYHLVIRALDLGVPLHLVHPSHSPEVDGKCKPSSLYLSALRSIFPGVPAPRALLQALAKLETKYDEVARAYHIKYKDESSFYASRLFVQHAHSGLHEHSSEWGFKQTFSGLPRARYMRYVEGPPSHPMRTVLQSLGYEYADRYQGACWIVLESPDKGKRK